jgi:hypothetical protein
MTYTASPAQIKFISDLLAKRVVPAAVEQAIKATQEMTSRQASAHIDLLKTYPYKVTGQANAVLSDLFAAFERVPNGRFALATEHLRTAFPTLSLPGDLLFLEVKTWNGRRYLNRLTGGGEVDFVRTRLPLTEQVGLLNLLALDPVEAMRTFGKHFTCCGRCGKALTDPVSRQQFLGPECRKALGLA